MNRRRAPYPGFTLAELMVVIAILGVMAAITGVALTTRVPAPTLNTGFALVAAVRDSAVRTGRVVTKQLQVSGEDYLVTAFPDGRIESNAPAAIDPLSGRKASAQQ